jgi:hypothetical protein
LHFIKINKNSLFSRQVYLKLTQIKNIKEKHFGRTIFDLRNTSKHLRINVSKNQAVNDKLDEAVAYYNKLIIFTNS